MALVDATLSAALKAIFDAMAAAASGTPKDNQYLADQLAAAIDTQIKTASVSVTVSSVSGVMTGPSASGPGSGTGTIS
jgi:hypothetical protein